MVGSVTPSSVVQRIYGDFRVVYNGVELSDNTYDGLMVQVEAAILREYLNLLKTTPKVPWTDEGINLVQSVAHKHAPPQHMWLAPRRYIEEHELVDQLRNWPNEAGHPGAFT